MTFKRQEGLLSEEKELSGSMGVQEVNESRATAGFTTPSSQNTLVNLVEKSLDRKMNATIIYKISI